MAFHPHISVPARSPVLKWCARWHRGEPCCPGFVSLLAFPWCLRERKPGSLKSVLAAEESAECEFALANPSLSLTRTKWRDAPDMLATFAVLEKRASHSFVSRNIKSSVSTGTSWAILTRNKPSKGSKE